MKKINFIIITAIAAVIITSSPKNNYLFAVGSTGNTANAITGSWHHNFANVAVILNAKADLTFILTVNKRVTTTGTYAVSGGVVTFINKTETRNDCINIPGLYNFAVTGHELKMALKHDPCPGRPQAIMGDWLKQ